MEYPSSIGSAERQAYRRGHEKARAEVAAEIERLRAALQELVDGYTPQYERMSADSPYKPMWASARVALTPNDIGCAAGTPVALEPPVGRGLNEQTRKR